MRVVYWGTYDSGKPRNRILIRGLRENGIEVIECHKNPWTGVEDKSQIHGYQAKVLLFFKWVFCYPPLIFRYLKVKRHDAVMVGYLGHLDVLVIWLFAKLRGTPVVWDAFLSLYDTVVDDRQMVSAKGLIARFLYCFEWLSCRAASLILLDTKAHAQFFIDSFHLSPDKCCSVFVGAEPEIFPVAVKKTANGSEKPLNILFYGQFIPLHGIEFIVEAANILRDSELHWTIIGEGQEESKIDTLLKTYSLPNVAWKRWVNYSSLKECISQADICLGIFGKSGKASRVIPNKVFQIISSGKILITRDSPAIRELLNKANEGVFLVPPGSPQDLAASIISIINTPKLLMQEPFLYDERLSITPHAIGKSLLDKIQKHMSKKHG